MGLGPPPFVISPFLQESVRKAGAILSKTMVNITQKKCDPSINADKDKCRCAKTVFSRVAYAVLCLHFL